MKYDIITFGSATLDVFLKAEDFLIRPIKEFVNRKGICFPFASKINIKNLCFRTGGGGTNTAATFALWGFKVAYCGRIGDDFAGHEVLKDLKRFKVSRSLVSLTKEKPTNSSIIFSFDRDRTCFVWRGASELLTKEEIPWDKLKAKWFYLAPLSGKLALLFEPLVNFAKEKEISVFANLGNSQINLQMKKLKPILEKIDILLLNQEEASLLTKIPYRKEKEVFAKLDNLIPGIAIMTKGKEGAVVSNGRYLWKTKPLSGPLVEKTGAGDAFGAGFLTGFIQKRDISFAIQLGIANASACLQKTGAKEGLLKKGSLWRKVKVERKKL